MSAFVGRRIAIHPASDRYTRDTHARVVRLRRRRADGPLWLRVIGERSGRCFWLHPSNAEFTFQRGI